MQNKQLFQEFINFCDSQPKGKLIDHSSIQSCAVGEFAESRGILLSEADHTNDWPKSAREWFGSLVGTPIPLNWSPYDVPRNRLVWKIIRQENSYPTYGEFTEMLKSYL